jgi:predicted transcriptional regulator of viral defense system
MATKPTKTARLLELARRQPILRVKDLLAAGIHPEHLRRLHRTGVVERTSRGVYRLVEADYTEHLSLAEVAKRVPHSVVCLLSALQFHQIGTHLPPDVWLAVERRAARPTSMNPRLRAVRMSGAAFREGIEEHRIEGVPVRVYCAAKTVVDCFKFRNKVGLDVALEALREGLRSGKLKRTDLRRFAAVCRVDNVMRPYLEAMT